jgi:hypothetical protein
MCDAIERTWAGSRGLSLCSFGSAETALASGTCRYRDPHTNTSSKAMAGAPNLQRM